MYTYKQKKLTRFQMFYQSIVAICQNAVYTLPVFACIVGLWAWLSFTYFYFPVELQFRKTMDLHQFLLMFVSSWVWVCLFSFMMAWLCYCMHNEKPTFWKLKEILIHQSDRFIWVASLYVSIIYLGLICFFLPGLYCIVAFTFVVPVAVLHPDLSVLKCLSKSRQIIKGNWWFTLSSYLICSCIAISVLYVLSLLCFSHAGVQHYLNSTKKDFLTLYLESLFTFIYMSHLSLIIYHQLLLRNHWAVAAKKREAIRDQAENSATDSQSTVSSEA